MLELLGQPETYVMLATLAGIEIVLGIDNLVFITILCGRLPAHRQRSARRVGLLLALVSRLGLLFTLGWVMHLTDPWISLLGRGFSGRDLILVGGGLFLLAKATHEIFHEVEHPVELSGPATAGTDAGTESPKTSGGSGVRPLPGAPARYGSILVQILLLDMVFSLDSVITAVGMVPHISIMAAAMVLAVIVMVLFVGPVGDFVQRHASVRILALSFLLLIGVLLLAEGFGQQVPRSYVYFSMGFALFVEVINLRRQARRVRLWTVQAAELSRLRAKALREGHALEGYEPME